ncbi:MAG: hypothetical protein M0024_09320 [Nitrospiraceae bacterium]|nr:hypothetical protein [Nitrospiraceae bacterium]
MLVGYNTNIPYKGNLYHVQTEDSGLKNPVITTLLYFKGTILSSKKISYAHIAANPDYKEKVRELMKEQHKAMMKELISGRHTGDAEGSPQGGDTIAEDAGAKPGQSSPAATDQPPPATSNEGAVRSLDDILLDFIINKGK